MRTLKMFVVAILMSLIGTVASCGTMGGGGGMRYFVEPPLATSASI